MNDYRDAPVPPDPHTLPLTPDIITTEWSEIDGQEALKHQAKTDTYWARISSDAECVPLKLVPVVAAVSETHPTELPLLYYDIGPDALDELDGLSITDAALGKLSTSMMHAGHSSLAKTHTSVV